MRSVKAIAIAYAAVIVALLVTCYAFLRSEGLSARKKPGNFEYAAANYAFGLSLPRGAKNRKNPIRVTSQALMDARRLYSDNCAVCHANDGTGKTNTARGLSPEVPDLHAEHIQKLADGEMLYIIKNGVRFTGMPAWDFRDEQLWKLVLLIRQFATEKSPDQAGQKPI